MTKGKALLRIAVDIALFGSIIEGWWFSALAIGLIGAWLLPYFAEALIAGFFYDGLFGMAAGMGLKGYGGTIAAAAILAIASGIKRVVVHRPRL
ncbi:MAG: hypothetical protein KGI45_02015 [Patescibacteria group bacterium]|nr:hypothetical protein [Patescibacteria group bacterium]